MPDYFKSSFFLISFSTLAFCARAQFSGNQTPTYPDLVRYYQELAKSEDKIELYNMGNSDYGLPVYVCILNGKEDSLKTFEQAKNGSTIFINNGIHPGEPDGINACGMIAGDFKAGKLKIKNDVLVAFVLCYNVGGMMNRSSSSRANQDGPEEYGFRGNAQNLDLNRDFIKMDSENAFTFARIFHALDPDLFIDTHVSNGADYQYTLTIIHSMKERMQASIRELTYNHFVPELEKSMKKQGIDLFPYVELLDETPDSGLEAFNDLPRYAMGYASLFHSISLTTETHMLKTFPERVKATHQYLKSCILWTEQNSAQIEQARKEAVKSSLKQAYFKYNYTLIKDRDSILFKGFEHGFKKSEVTGLDRLYYDRSKPYERYIKHFRNYSTADSVKIPEFYVVGAQCKDVIVRLKQNQVRMQVVSSDSLLSLSFFRVQDYKSGTKPYEGHFLHREMEIREEQGQIRLKKGDVLIPTNQSGKNFICSVLEPEAEDSYFAWNFFDSYLQEKEYFSSYVFEDLAVKILEESAELRSLFEEKKKQDEKFASSQWEQLYFIYKNSVYFEPTFMRLPVFKIY